MIRLEVEIGKAEAVPAFRTMRKIETQMFKAARAEWTRAANRAIVGAVGSLPRRALTDKDVEKVQKRLATAFPGSWPSVALRKTFRTGSTEIYRLSKKSIADRASGKLRRPLVLKQDFTTIDRQAIDFLDRQQTFWLGEYFDDTTVRRINTAAYGELVGARGRDAGDILRRIAEGSFGVGEFAELSDAYWTGVSVNASTTARVNSALLEMREIGLTVYQVSNPTDRRTTEICTFMDGKEIPVGPAASQIEELIEADAPLDIKKLHGWQPHTFQSTLSGLGISPTASSLTPKQGQAITEVGLGFPPYHFRCRSTVDVVL